MSVKLLAPEEIRPSAEKLSAVTDQLKAALFGQERIQKLLITAMLARGHVLLEGLPGLGKTALVNTIAQLLDLKFRRVQFTPDLMPGDILGTNILQERDGGRREMVFQEGPVFTNILLGDEINRASPKTQSALLEAMQERTVTTIGETRKLPFPFFVLATQNPIELEGTYPLPEAQVDRFLFKLNIYAPDEWVLEKIITERKRGEIPPLTPIMSAQSLKDAFAILDRIQIPSAVGNYIARLVKASTPESGIKGVSEYIRFGASPRAAIAIAEAARAYALIEGRPSVGFADVETVAPHALQHRIVLDYRARSERMSADDLVKKIIAAVPSVPHEPPKGVELSAGR